MLKFQLNCILISLWSLIKVCDVCTHSILPYTSGKQHRTTAMFILLKWKTSPTNNKYGYIMNLELLFLFKSLRILGQSYYFIMDITLEISLLFSTPKRIFFKHLWFWYNYISLFPFVSRSTPILISTFSFESMASFLIVSHA